MRLVREIDCGNRISGPASAEAKDLGVNHITRLKPAENASRMFDSRDWLHLLPALP